MSQTISYLRGQAATVEALNAATSAATDAGLKKKVTFTVSSTTANVSAHIGIFGCGVALIEDSAIALDTTKYFSTGMSAFAGTLCYRLDSALYTRPVLTIETGILAVASDPLLLVIGWVNYPGGNVALAKEHFKSAPVGSIAFSLPIPTTSGYLYYDQATDSFAWQEIAEADTYKFKVNDTDPLPGYMADKIADTSDVSLSINAVTRKLEAKLLVDIPAPDDHMLLASSADQTPGYLVSKIADTPSIKLDINSNNKLEATFLGSLSGDHLVYADVDDATPGNLMAKLVSGNTDYVTITKKSGTTAGGAVNDQVSLTIVGAPPLGAAGGDLTGSYPNPTIKQVTGVGAALATAATGTWSTDGRGIAYGTVFKYATSAAAKVSTNAWIALDKDATLYRSVDNWATYSVDTSLKTAYGTTYGGGDGFVFIRHVYIQAVSYTGWAWMVVLSALTGQYIYIPDVAASYNNDGSFVQSAWTTMATSGLDQGVVQGVVFNDGKSAILLSGYQNKLYYTADFVNFSSYSFNHHPGGVGYDNYGTFITTQRNQGTIYINDSLKRTGTFTLNSWVQLKAANGLTLDSGSGPVAIDNLPRAGTDADGSGSTWWTNAISSYGVWVILCGKQYTGDGNPSFVYSKDGYAWTLVTSTALVTFYSCDTDGTRWFATLWGGTGFIAQLLIDSIPVHRRIICEQGAIIAGDTFLADLKSVDVVGTDGNGRAIVGVGGSDASFTAGQATNILTKKSGNLAISSAGATVTLTATLLSRAIRLVSSVSYTIIVPVGITFTCSGIVYDATLAEKHVSVPSGYVLQLFQATATAWFGTTNATLVIAS